MKKKKKKFTLKKVKKLFVNLWKKVLEKLKELITADNLEEIRQEIIFGSVSKEKLIEISRLVKQKDVETDDEKLKEILAEIELRVEVELAKLVK